MTSPIEAIFRPRSIAIIGASRDPDAIGSQILHNLITHRFNGVLYPVNPKTPVIHSMVAYPSIAEVPGDVDLAIVVVPAPHVLSVLEACGRKGVRAAVIITAGFKETGPEGAAREAEVLECARRHGIRVVGPNCLGVLNTEAAVCMDATFAPAYPPAGPVAFSSQSGALGLAILQYALDLKIGMSQFVSVGNKADVSSNDLLEFWENDPGTGVVLLYLESFGNPRRFTQTARRVGRKKPIVAVKSGRTSAGSRAASSHTGSMAGADVAVDALCVQSGMIRTDTIEEMFDLAMLLANQPVPRGNRVGIVTNAGGPGIMASDACESNGLVVPLLDPATVDALRAFLPREASTKNPVDMIASATAETFERSVRLVLNDPNIDALLAIYVQPLVTQPREIINAIVQGAATAAQDARDRGEEPKPVLSCLFGAHALMEGIQTLQRNKIPSYSFPEAAAIALAHAVRYNAWRSQAEGRLRAFPDVDKARAAAILEAARGETKGGTAWLRPEEVREVLAAYGIRMPGSGAAATAAEAVAVARKVGFPVAVKLVSDTISHKSDVGGVILDVRSEDEVVEAFERIQQSLNRLGRLKEMAGVTVQRMVTEGIEGIIGVTQDPNFGPLIMFGLGGVHVELLKDVVFRISPLTDRDAREMVHAVRGYPLLEGYRGAPPGDVPALEEAVLRVSQLVCDHPGIVEMDLNPLKVQPPGEGCLVVDARIAVRGR